jgi:hypothetical protein
MKKFTLLFLFFSLALSAQVFPEYDPTLLKPGMKLKTDDEITWYFQNFYSDSLGYEHYKPGSDKYKTPPNEVIGRIFEIVNVKPKGTKIPAEYYLIKLTDIATQEILYFKTHVAENSTTELLMIDTIDFPTDYFCKYVKASSGDELIFVSFSGILRLEKFHENGLKYNLYLKTEPFKKNNGTGTITLNLKNGKKIIKKNMVAFEEGGNSLGEMSYGARVPLTTEDLKLLMESEIVSYDFFGMYEKKLKQQKGSVLKGSIDCFMKR